MEASHTTPSVPGRLLGGRDGDPNSIQDGAKMEFLSQPALLPMKEEPEEKVPQRWEAQWPFFLRAAASPHSGGAVPRPPESSDGTKVILPHFSGVGDASPRPRGQRLPQSPLGFSGEAQQADGRVPSSSVEVKEEILDKGDVALDVWRQRFRSYCYGEAEGPWHALGHLQALCCQWLKPEGHSKEQLVQLVVLEQFLSILPPGMQSWVRRHDRKAAGLAEGFVTGSQEAELQEQERYYKNDEQPGIKMEASHTTPSVPGGLLGGRDGDPNSIQDGAKMQFLSQPALLPVKEEPEEKVPQRWEAQWPFFLRAAASPHSGGAVPWPPESSDGTKVILPHFSGVGDASPRPRGQRLPQSLLGFSREAQQADGRVPSSSVEVKEEILDKGDVALDVWRQRFRSYCYGEAEGPWHALGHLQALCCQWLKPEGHSKEQLVQLVVLEQFLSILPPGMQSWVRRHDPKVAGLAEGFVTGSQEAELQEQEALTPFEEVVENSFKTELPPSDAPAEVEPSMETMQEGVREASLLAEHEQKGAGARKKDYRCSHCDKVFSWRSHLTRHERTHTGEKLYRCAICEKCFGQASHLAIHERTHTGEKPYKCTACGKTFIQSSALLRHMVRHTSKRSHKCLHCGKSFRRRSQLVRHVPNHIGKKSYEGSTCEETFVQSSALSRHMMSHTGENGFQCSHCGKSFQWKSHLVRHMPTHTGEKLHKCSWCEKTFTQLSALPIHERIHTGEKPYSCSTCGKKFVARAHLVVHERSHTGKKPYTCSSCGRGFSNTSCLAKHKRIHTGEKPYKCSLCEKCFGHMSSLTKHKRSHTGEKPYRCSDCGKSFVDSSKLARHKRTHVEERPYECSVCGKGFRESYHLIRHERNHAGDRPYSCSTCGKSFINRWRCSTHERTHTGEKPYQCMVCGRSFGDQSNLLNHQRIHAGAKLYKCEICGKHLSRQEHLINHYRTHTGEKPYECLDCDKSFIQRIQLLVHDRTHHTGEIQ